VNLERFRRLEYQALRKITGAYHGASQQKLEWIAGIEPLQSRLDHISICWAARSLGIGDTEIRRFLEAKVSPGHTEWHDGTGREGFKTEGPINSAFYLTPINHPEERSYGDRHDTAAAPLTHYPLIDPRDERSKSKAYWAGTIGGRMEEGWRIGYTDGTEANGLAASGVHSEDRRKDLRDIPRTTVFGSRRGEEGGGTGSRQGNGGYAVSTHRLSGSTSYAQRST